MTKSAWDQERPRVNAELASLQDGQGGFVMSDLTRNTLILAANTVSVVQIGERLGRVMANRHPVGDGFSSWLVGLTSSPVMRLPETRREEALRTQPELTRAHATRAVNAVTALSGKAYLVSQLRSRHPDVVFSPGEADEKSNAKAFLAPFLETEKAHVRARNIIYMVDASDRSDERWETTLTVAQCFMGEDAVQYDLHSLIAQRLNTSCRPIPHPRHPALVSILDVLCMAMPAKTREHVLKDMVYVAMDVLHA